MAQRLATADDLPDEFDGVDSTFWLGVAAHHIDVDRWGELASSGHALATAHLLASNGLGSSAGASVVTSRSVGPVSESYAAGASGSPVWGTTRYGQQFEELRRYILGGPWLTL